MCIDFSEYALGTDIATQYTNSSGVAFTNGRYQVSRSASFMSDDYGLFSFQGEIHIHLQGEASAIGVHLYQKYLRIRLLDDKGIQAFVSEFDHPQSFFGAVVPDLAFSQVVLDCWNGCALENEVAGCCRFLNMDRICFRSEYNSYRTTISASPSVAPSAFTPSVSASPSPTPKLSAPFVPSAVSSMSPIASRGFIVVAPNDSASAQRTLAHTLVRLSIFWLFSFL
jgi:hypothetical protein